MSAMVATYSTAIMALCVWTLALIILGFVSGFYKNVVVKVPAGASPEPDMGSAVFRAVRAFENGYENYSTFIAASLFAMLAGANVTILTWVIVAVVILRLLFSITYIMRLGADGGGPRTICYVFSEIGKLVIIVMAILALL